MDHDGPVSETSQHSPSSTRSAESAASTFHTPRQGRGTPFERVDRSSPEDRITTSPLGGRPISPEEPVARTIRFSSNNPFASNIRPVSDLPVDDAFDYSYDYDGPAVRSSVLEVNHGARDSQTEVHPAGSLRKRDRHISFVDTPDSGGRKARFAQEEIRFDFEGEHQGHNDANFQDNDNSNAEIARHGSIMKRHRWGTQRHKKGRPPKRSRSIFRHRRVSQISKLSDVQENPQQHSPNLPGGAGFDEDGGDETASQPRKIYVNIPLPHDMISPDTGLPIADYPRNKIRTTKYTPLSFIPKNLFFQFQNVANIYFLFIVILGAFPIFGVDDPGLAAVPVIVIVVITAIKDAVEDYRRTVLDMELNNTPTQILAYNPNYNVTDENISLWRKFKKANTRLMLRVVRAVNSQIKSIRTKKQNGNANRNSDTGSIDDVKGDGEIGHQLTRATTVYSVYSTNGEEGYSMDDLSVSGAAKEMSDPFGDQFAESTTRTGSVAGAGSVLDLSSSSPGKAKFRRDFWKSVRVGDFVRVHNNEEIPADIVILGTSDSDGACYVETKNLDGETNLKVRQALKCGEGIKHSKDCERAKFWIESEGPQPNLYTYNGVAKWYDHGSTTPSGEPNAEPISINNVALRGCTLRNTDWVIGVVLFTGVETKIMLNAGETPTKKSLISRELNYTVIANFVLLFILCFVSGLLNGLAFAKSNTSITYFEFGSIGGSAPVDGLITFWADVILYQSLVPISLYISIEIVKTIQAFFIYSDCFMYHEPIDYPCTPKSWNISDDLGQIEYIFSDKTGTLTQNVMEFKKCSINGVAYGKAYTEAYAGLRKREGVDVVEEGARMRAEIANDKVEMIRSLRQINDNPELVDDDVTFISTKIVEDMRGSSGEEQQEACRHFMLALALCHSVITEESDKRPSGVEYKAQSPDEAALVGTARDLGFTFKSRTQKGVIVNVQGEETEYQILNTLEFNSTRKRMSAIVKLRENDRERILLICKGADSVIYSRLKEGEQHELREETALHLEQFAQEGLRTLCIAQRELSAKEYNEWNARHEVATTALTNREEQMEEVADSIERELTLLGGTAIEDRLQDGVPQSIALLGEAGIKLWVLTGDKVETAINIGFSCNLLENSMELLVLRVEDGQKSSVSDLISQYLEQYFHMSGSQEELIAAKSDHSPPSPQYAVIIDGDTLKLALDDEVRVKFLLLCKQCKSVLCCRVSPAQKAAVVHLVKSTLGVMTLSIGDGANDVAMIQEADVGVGIAGEEGRQAVMSSDYAIGQFRFLSRLLLVHGRWSYKRLAEMIPNFFYKNVVFTLSLFWYGIFSSFDGTYLFDYTYVMFFNLAFTSLPVIFMGFLDQDVDDRISLAIPQLYQRGILRKEWGQTKFWVYMVDGVYQSAIAFFFPYLLYYTAQGQDIQGLPLNHRFWMGLAVCTIGVFSCNIYVLLNQYRWDWLSVLIVVLSCLFVWLWTGAYSSFVASSETYGLANEMMGACIYWAVSFVGIVVCILPHFVYLCVSKMMFPQDVDIVREQWQMGEFDNLPPPGQSEVERVATANGDGDGEECYSPKGSSPDSDATLASSSNKTNKKGRRTSGMSWIKRSHGEDKHEYEGNSDDRRDLIRTTSTPAGSMFDVESGYSGLSNMERVPSSYSISQTYHTPQTTFHTPQVGYGSNLTVPHDRSERTRSSLERTRESMRMEQYLPRRSIESVRTSMDMNELTTANGLMKRMSHDGAR
uniref:Phospholipid-transporting ATPase n=1 Tax=Blastobotrys adeninivorans TaxID=409370 RepID=A0A060SZE9_BLAAD